MMRLSKLVIYVLFTLPVALMGCTNDDSEESSPNGSAAEAICFSAEVAGITQEDAGPSAGRRAMNTMETTGQLADGGGFGVFGSYTGLYRFADSNITSNFMYNTRVSYDDVNSVWTYDPIKYWPNGEGVSQGGTGASQHYVSFFAYAPWSNQMTDNPAGYCIPTFHQQYEVTNPWLTYRLHTDVTQQVDLLYAVPLLDRVKPGAGQRIRFDFRHAMACVGDRVTLGIGNTLRNMWIARVAGSISNISVVLTAVTVRYTLTEKARLVLWTGGEANWQKIVSGNTLTERSVSLNPTDGYALPYELFSYDGSSEGGGDWQDEGHGVFYIPLHVDGSPQQAEVTINYDVITTVAGTPMTVHKTSTTTLTLSDYVEAYQAGKHLYLNMTLIKE